MTSKLGIIVAGGEAARFKGIPKELMPISDTETLLSRAVEVLSFCDKVQIITSREKIGQQSRAIPAGDKVFYTIDNGAGMWDAMTHSFPFMADCNYFVMPDTFLPLNAFDGYEQKRRFGLGCHLTNKPERFGCIYDGVVINKVAKHRTTAKAWGVLVWQRAVVDHWKMLSDLDYTSAINVAMQDMGYETWMLEYYYDCATLKDYLDMMGEV